MNNKEEAEKDYSVHCNVRGGDCYNPTCMLNGKCIDFINRESYLRWEDDECKKAIERLTKDKEQIVSDFRAALIQAVDREIEQTLNEMEEFRKDSDNVSYDVCQTKINTLGLMIVKINETKPL